MTSRLMRWIERVLGRWEEGPEAPARLFDVAEDFAERHPRATRGQWTAFAAEHARRSYREGFRRGYEHAERDPMAWKLEHEPEEIADLIDPTWRIRPVDITNPNFEPPEVMTEAEATLFDLEAHLKDLVDAAETRNEPYDDLT